jgi:hypothetical protein
MSSLGQWTDLEKKIQGEMNARAEREGQAIVCSKCGGSWFFEQTACQYREDHNVIVGQGVPKVPGAPECKFLVCIYCLSQAGASVLEPRIEASSREIVGGKKYDFCLDTLEGKHDKNREVNGVIDPKAIPTKAV